ncbi:MAG: phosphotransferase enzyme family protein [Anaerolineae bacterium]
MKIPQAILDAGALRFGVGGADIRYLGGGGPGAGGVVYCYHRDGAEWSLKFMPGGEETAQINNEKLNYVRYLAEQGVSVPMPQSSISGHFSEVVVSGHDSYIVSSETVAPGRHVNTRNPAEWNKAYFSRWGQLIGRIHDCATRYPFWRKPDKHAFDEPPTLIHDWEDEWRSFDEWCQEDAVRERWREIHRKLEKLPIERSSFGLIQNDPHPWNILMHGSQLTLIDYDVAGYTWFMMDLGIAAYAALCLAKPETTLDSHDYTVSFLGSFLSGYRAAIKLDTFWLQQLPIFLSYRRILLFIVLYEESKKHPEHLNRWREAILTDEPIVPAEITLEWSA